MTRYGVIELWRPKSSWYALSRSEKERFLAQTRDRLGDLMKQGAEARGPFRARFASRWDAFALWEMPTLELVTGLAEANEEGGWFRYFEQEQIVGQSTTTPQYVSDLLSAPVDADK